MAAAAVAGSDTMGPHLDELASLIRQRQQRIAFGAANTTARMFTQKEYQKREYQR
jgi:hypothetical protein